MEQDTRIQGHTYLQQSARKGGLGITNLSVEAPLQYASSCMITSLHVESTIDQSAQIKQADRKNHTVNDLKKDSA